MNADTLERIKSECEIVEQSGFGTVKIAVKNGAIYLIETSCSQLVELPSAEILKVASFSLDKNKK